MSSNKSGVPWKTIEERYRAGESATALARDYPISRQRIEVKAKKRNWRPKTELKLPAVRRGLQQIMDRDWPPDPMWLSFVGVTETAKRLKKPRDDSDRRLVAAGKCSRASLARILTLVAEGKTRSVAAKYVGVPPKSLTDWLRADSGLAELFDKATAFVDARHITRLEEAIEGGDAASVRWALERKESTREDYRRSGDRGPHGLGEINVMFNLSPPLPPEEWVKKHGKGQGVVIEGNAKDMTTHAIPDRRAGKDG